MKITRTKTLKATAKAAAKTSKNLNSGVGLIDDQLVITDDFLIRLGFIRIFVKDCPKNSFYYELSGNPVELYSTTNDEASAELTGGYEVFLQMRNELADLAVFTRPADLFRMITLTPCFQAMNTWKPISARLFESPPHRAGVA